MIRRNYILFVFFACISSLTAQTTSIIDDLNTHKVGEGKITVYQDASIKKLLGTTIQGSSNGPNTDPNNLANQLNSSTNTESSSQTNLKTKGFKIQVYSGSGQKAAKNEAESRRNSVKSSYPNMEVTVTYNSPVWRVKAGNFKTREEASQALADMKQKLPVLGREMIIISDIVKIPVIN